MRRHRVLVVDDSEVIRRLIAINLEFAGIDVCTTDDGAGAIQLAADWHPDLITLDVNMPGLNGFETAHRLRSRPETAATPIVLLTARTHPGDKAAADRLGIGAYVTKPFEPEDLVNTILSLLPDAPERPLDGSEQPSDEREQPSDERKQASDERE